MVYFEQILNLVNVYKVVRLYIYVKMKAISSQWKLEEFNVKYGRVSTVIHYLIQTMIAQKQISSYPVHPLWLRVYSPCLVNNMR